VAPPSPISPPLLAFAPHLGAGRGATAGQGRLAVG